VKGASERVPDIKSKHRAQGMSIRVMSDVWQVNLPDSEKLVLLALADSANDEGHCWPSMATLARKCSKGDRTVQGAIKSLVEKGHLTRNEVIGKGCNYTVHPRRECAPAEPAPRSEQQEPPQRLRDTPAAAADKPSKNHKQPSKRQEARAVDHELPDDWQPQPFGLNTESRKIVDGWPPGEAAIQLETFRAHHGKKGDRFKDWQKAWSTWVLNSRNFRRPQNGKQPDTDGFGRTGRAVMAVRERIRSAGVQ